MTTKSAAAIHPPVAVGDYTDENGVFYPETDGEPLPDGFDQEYLFQQVMPVLWQYLKSREDEAARLREQLRALREEGEG